MPLPRLIPATLRDYPTVQNMARFYVYDRTSFMGWECPEDGLFECIDFRHYFETPHEKAFLIKVGEELAGFVLLDQVFLDGPVDWNMGEFFVLGKFQHQGIGTRLAQDIFSSHPGKWSVAVMPENTGALHFWRGAIGEASNGHFKEVFKTADELRTPENPDPSAMIIFSFETPSRVHAPTVTVRRAEDADISGMVALSSKKRLAYEKVSPQFWRHAACAEEIQSAWFRELLVQEDSILLVAEAPGGMEGFVIGRLIKAPEVYDPGGLTLMVDDFCVTGSWQETGRRLLEVLQDIAKKKGAVQICVVTGRHDEPKRRFLKSFGLTATSEWYVGGFL